MSNSSSARRQFWRADWFVGAAIVLAVLTLHLATDILDALLRSAFGGRSGFSVPIVAPAWGVFALAAVSLLVAAHLIVVLPRLPTRLGAFVTASAFLALLATESVLLAWGGTWLKLILPAALLVVGHLALLTRRLLLAEASQSKVDDVPADTHRMMGLALQGQGRLDLAFDRFRRVPMNEEVMANLYNLALDFERQWQFDQAQAVFEHMAAFDRQYKDVATRVDRARSRSASVIPAAGGSPPRTMPLDGGEARKPMLGRYELDKELGKGAMGVVYLGKDPTIGRVVAIKTMALSHEFDGDELTDARERFFREAETAGRLQHQNIVTIFDAGEERGLAYIAMEFIKGRDLVDHCRDGALLPMPKVVAIVARVAEALAYAHRQNVVHRDIKPANIMYDPQSDTVKVTDFGIARITDSSKTRTGMVLGTPSFMSPEQIAGKKVDGRSDLYSLGVMLFQMLTGVLPFRGESMGQLLNKIANDDAPDLRIVRRDIPERLANVVALSLSKRPETRYQDGDQFAADLRSVLVELTSGAASLRADASAATRGEAALVAAIAGEKTQVLQAGAAQARSPDRTAVLQPQAAVPSPRTRPGYDATLAKDEGADAAFARTRAVQFPAASRGTGDQEV